MVRSMPKVQPTNQQIYNLLTHMNDRLDSHEEKLSRMEKNLDWLVGENKKFDEDKTVSDYRQRENTDEIERLKARASRVEEHLHLPSMKFSF